MPAAEPERSPYQPPAMLPDEERRLAVAGDRPLGGPMPLLVPALFALVADLISAALMVGMVVFENSPIMLLLLCSPLLLLALFVLRCLYWPPWRPWLIRRSVLWEVAIFVLVPLVSLVVFVPTLIATMLLVLAFFDLKGQLSMYFPVFLLLLAVGLAYFLTAVAISRWLWWWLVQRSPLG
jgi:hypothetical protein